MFEARPDYLAPPPRPVPWQLQSLTLFGGLLSQIGWGLLFGGLFFFWIFGFNSELMAGVRLGSSLAPAFGVVQRSERTGASENDYYVFAIHYSFAAADGQQYQGVSYATGQWLEPNTLVQVEYRPDDPSRSRIVGLRSALFGEAAAFVIIFPAAGLVLLGLAWPRAWKAWRLLRSGEAGTATLINKQPTGARVNGRPVFRLTFEGRTADGRPFQISESSWRPERLEDDRAERVLYDPANPARAVLFDNLPGRPRLDERGSFQAPSGRRALLALALPLLTVAVHGTVFALVW